MPRPLLRSPLPLTICLVSLGVALMTGLLEAQTVRITGLQSVAEEQARLWIASQVQLVESAGVSPARADDLAFFLENAMREQGYSEATVDWKVQGKQILLSVSEGSTLLIGAISIEGNQALEDEAVVELLTAATRKRLKKDADDAIPYVKQDIELGRKKIISFYDLLGYRDSEVIVEMRPSRGRADLFLSVTEGSKGEIGAIAIPEAPSAELARELEKIRQEFTGKIFSGAVPGNLSSRVRAVAVDMGFYHAKVTVEEGVVHATDGLDQIDLVVLADWGDPVALSSLRVKGNEKIRDEFFERHFSKLVNRPYSPAEANKSVNELLQTGAFETVRTDVVAQDDGTYHLDIEVEEGYSRTLGVYGGFTNYEGPIAGFEFSNLNLFGIVRKMDATLEGSTRGIRGELNYTDPWFLGSNFEFGGGLFAINRKEEGYEKFKTGGRYEFRRRLGRKKKDSIALFGEASYTDVHRAEIAPIYLGDRGYFSHQLGLSYTFDRRDDPLRPRKGFLAQTSLGIASSALGSEIEYLKATGRLGYYLPFGENTLRLGARAGLISPMGNTNEIPIDLRFFNGGPYSVRSFQERAMGLRDPGSGYSVGGNFYTAFSAEYEIPLAIVDGLSLVPFADAGNLLFDDSDASLDDLRYAVGLGLRYETPIGPIRLEYGLNPDQRAGEPRGTFHVGFGLGY